tara:strand:- start:28 stop:414 length:387 start_codon:yes stop_codon:yes gene_type:complete
MSTITVTNIKATGETASRSATSVAAAWCNFNGSGTPAFRDSFNHSSLTDNGTGDFSPVMTNAMANINYAQSASMSRATDADTDSINTNNATGADVAPTTTTYRFGALQFGTGGVDVTFVNFAIHGDLA